MKKPALYSSAHRQGRSDRPPAKDATVPDRAATGRPATSAPDSTQQAQPAAESVARPSRLRSFFQRHDRTLLFVAGLACALAVIVARDLSRPKPAALTQEDIDKAVLHTFENKTLPSRAA